MVFSVVMYGCESWTVKKAECRRIDAFELWCWRRLLRVPWTARRSEVYSKGNQSLVFIGRTDAKAETPILWPPHVKNWLIGKDWSWEWLGEGGEGDNRRWDWLDGITDSVGMSQWNPGVGDGQGGLACCDSWSLKESDMTEQLNLTELTSISKPFCVLCVLYLSAHLILNRSFTAEGSVGIPDWPLRKLS